MRRFAAWSGRNGAYGTVAGRDAGASSPPCAAGRNDHPFVTWLASTLVHYAARRQRGEPISTAFVENAINEIVAKRMNKKQQMRWNRTTVQLFLDVRTAVLNETLEDVFRGRYLRFRLINDADTAIAMAA